MSEYPKFWEQIINRLGLQSFEGIENIRNVLNFMGYTTLQSISKLCKQSEMSSFQIEVAKLNTNSQFCAKYPELQNWQLGHGTVAILKDISNAAISCMTYDVDAVESVKDKVFRRCIKVAPNLQFSNVLVDLNGKAKCEIICPFDSCKDVTKLSVIKQINFSVPPKFNVFNFERHVNSQHLSTKRKRDIDTSMLKATEETLVDCEKKKNHRLEIHEKSTLRQLNCEISQEENGIETHTSTPLRQRILSESTLTPKTANILELENKLQLANEKIKSFEESVPRTAQSTSSSSSSSSSASMTPKSTQIKKLSSDLSIAGKITSKLREENILLRHKYMDESGKIRTFCRIKPDTSGDCFDWRCCSDGTNIQICKYKKTKKPISVDTLS